jgi:hypothetical protein
MTNTADVLLLDKYRLLSISWRLSMSAEYPFIPPHLEKGLEDISIPLIDLMHGHLKVEMLDCEVALQAEPTEFLEGYMEALTNMYCLTYNLSIDRKQIEERYFA